MKAGLGPKGLAISDGKFRKQLHLWENPYHSGCEDPHHLPQSLTLVVPLSLESISPITLSSSSPPRPQAEVIHLPWYLKPFSQRCNIHATCKTGGLSLSCRPVSCTAERCPNQSKLLFLTASFCPTDGRLLHPLQPAARPHDPRPSHSAQPLLQAQELQDGCHLRSPPPGTGAQTGSGSAGKFPEELLKAVIFIAFKGSKHKGRGCFEV